MAIDPSALNDLTISYNELMDIPIGDRVLAAEASPSFLDSILKALTPIQVAKAFPDYYRKALPDVTNFITANIQKKLTAGGMEWSQQGGGSGGTAQPAYSGESKLSGSTRPQGVAKPSLDQMKKELLKKGIDIDGIYSAVGTNGISADDEKVKYLKTVSPDQLSQMGFEQVDGQDGKKIIRLKPTEASQLSDAEVISKATGNTVGEKPTGMTTKQSFMYGLQKRGFTKEEAAAIAGNVESESGFKTNIQDYKQSGHWGYMQWGGDRHKGLVNYAASMNADWQDPEIQMDWIALERSGGSVKYGGTNEKAAYDQALASGDVGQMAQGFVTYVERPSAAEIAQSAPGRISNAVDAYNNDVTTYAPKLNAQSTKEEIQKARDDMSKSEVDKRKENAANFLYNQNDQTSSSATPVPGGTTTFVSPVSGTFEANASEHYGAGRGSYAAGGTHQTGPKTRKHSGADWQAADGSNVVFPVNGTVIHSAFHSGYANMVDIMGDDGRVYRLAMHGQPAQNWQTGQKVNQGDVAGQVAEGHLHFEVIPQTINGGANPVWNEFNDQLQSGKGGFVSTSGQRGTADPSQELGIQTGQQVAAGTSWKQENADTKSEAASTTKTPTATPAPTTPPPPALAQGGFIPEKDNLSVVNESGDTVARINQGELDGGIRKEGTGLRVESNKKRYAEDLIEKNDKSEPQADEAPQQLQNDGTFKQTVDSKAHTHNMMPHDMDWRQHTAGYREAGTQARAFKKSKFIRDNQYRFEKATPNSFS